MRKNNNNNPLNAGHIQRLAIDGLDRGEKKLMFHDEFSVVWIIGEAAAAAHAQQQV